MSAVPSKFNANTIQSVNLIVKPLCLFPVHSDLLRCDKSIDNLTSELIFCSTQYTMDIH